MSFSVDLSALLIKIWDVIAGELKHLRSPKPRIEEMKKASERLQTEAADINSRINQHQREGRIPTNQIQLWMNDVKGLKDKAAEAEQDFERKRCLGGWSWNCFTVNRRVAKRMDEIDKLMARVDATPVAAMPPPLTVVQIPISNSTLAMEAYMTEILGHIASTNAGVIGIYGMGGVGKTTLLRNINNHKDVTVFDHVIWAVASKECKMEKLQMDIAKRLKLQLEDDDSENDRAAKLFDFSKDKNCLLLLDDLWVPLDLSKLGMTHATSGQGEEKRKVVVFTTRQEEVCGGMKVSKKMEIKCLEPEEAWELFRRNAGEDAIGSDAGISRIAHQIAEECAGLPLAFITVGMAMCTKKSWEAWSDALTMMKHSQMPKITGMKETDLMFSAFKLSYDNLEDDDMRDRLLSCALWPEDHSIKREELIECWMGLGLIDEVGEIHKAYNRGQSHVETLKAACLLEAGNKETEVKMHDVIRDMALWMASDCGKKIFKWIVRAGVTASQAFEEEGWHEAERASLMYNDIASIPNQLSTCSKLSLLMLQHNYKLQEICGSFIQAMCSLMYLDFEHTRIKEPSKEIGMLSHLRLLNLSYTLIRELPAELGCLVKLKYLFLRSTRYLTVVAKGAISSLSSLKLLDLRSSGYVDCWDELDGLEGCQKSISIDITTAAALQRMRALSHVSIWQLKVKSLKDYTNLNQLLDDILRSHNIRQNMEYLKIEDAEMAKLLISEGKKEAGGFECLKYLVLSSLRLLRKITWSGVQPQIVFVNLRELIIHRCHKLRNVNWTIQLPSLSVLSISFCDAMQELIGDEGYSNSSSFGLKRLRLSGMFNLKRISPRPLLCPYLEEIDVLSCPLLRKLRFDSRISVNRLNAIRCEQTWWDNLEWEEISIKDSLSPLVGRNQFEEISFQQLLQRHMLY